MTNTASMWWVCENITGLSEVMSESMLCIDGRVFGRTCCLDSSRAWYGFASPELECTKSHYIDSFVDVKVPSRQQVDNSFLVECMSLH